MSGGTYGPGTAFPIQWKRYASTSSHVSDDIVRFQWRANKVKLECEGSVTITFQDPNPLSTATETKTASFALSTEITADITGADASVRLPTDLTNGDSASFNGNASDVLPVTCSWGPEDIAVNASLAIGAPYNGNLGIEDDGFLNYRKGISVNFLGAGSGFANTVFISSFSFNGPATGENADIFFGTAPLYTSGLGSATFTKFKVTLTDELPVP